MKLITIILLAIISTIFPKNTYTITVKITNFKSSKGKCNVTLFNTANGFPAKAEQAFQNKTTTIIDNAVVLKFENIPNGTYAIAVMHDENDNKKMDTNFLGIPKEGYGISNNKYPIMSAPFFDDAKFVVSDDKYIIIKMKY
jgi:uncharacterized protein (DUF2141 family)